MPRWGIAVATTLITENWFLFKAGYLGERQIYNLETVVGCLGKKSALSNSSKSWRGVSFYNLPEL